MPTKPLSKRQQNEIDAEIDRIYNRNCIGIEISVLDIPKVFRAGRDAHVNGQSVEDAVVSTVQSLRKN